MPKNTLSFEQFIAQPHIKALDAVEQLTAWAKRDQDDGDDDNCAIAFLDDAERAEALAILAEWNKLGL